ncbi:MAG: cyclase family protein [Bacillota bacterium]
MGSNRYIDLTMEIPAAATFPVEGYPECKIEFAVTPETVKIPGSERWIRKISCCVHESTHMDAPCHYLGEGYRSIDQWPLETLLGEALVVDLDGQISEGEGITAAHLEKAVGSKVKKGDRLIFKTGWLDKTWGKSYKGRHNLYYNLEASPYLTKEGADWVVEKGIILVALDFVLDTDQSFPAHWVLLPNDVCIVEHINSSRLSKEKVFLIALPLKIVGSDGSMARVVAIEELD